MSLSCDHAAQIIVHLARDLLSVSDTQTLRALEERAKELITFFSTRRCDFSLFSSALYKLLSDKIEENRYWADLPYFTWRVCIVLSSASVHAQDDRLTASLAARDSHDSLLHCYPMDCEPLEDNKTTMQKCFTRVFLVALRSQFSFKKALALAWHVTRLLALKYSIIAFSFPIDYRQAMEKIMTAFEHQREDGSDDASIRMEAESSFCCQ